MPIRLRGSGAGFGDDYRWGAELDRKLTSGKETLQCLDGRYISSPLGWRRVHVRSTSLLHRGLRFGTQLRPQHVTSEWVEPSGKPCHEIEKFFQFNHLLDTQRTAALSRTTMSFLFLFSDGVATRVSFLCAEGRRRVIYGGFQHLCSTDRLGFFLFCFCGHLHLILSVSYLETKAGRLSNGQHIRFWVYALYQALASSDQTVDHGIPCFASGGFQKSRAGCQRKARGL